MVEHNRFKVVFGSVVAGSSILEDAPAVDVVAVCCGGGGLLSGVAAAVKQACPQAGQCVVTVGSGGFGGFALRSMRRVLMVFCSSNRRVCTILLATIHLDFVFSSVYISVLMGEKY